MGPSTVIRSSAFAVCSLVPLLCWPQPVLDLHAERQEADIVVRGILDDPSEPVPVFQATWRSVIGGAPDFQLLPTAAPREDVDLMLDRLVEAALSAYLDTRIHFAKQGVKADLPADEMAREMDAMVMAACEELGVDGAFSGFAGPTKQQLDRLSRIDWSQARFGIDGGADQDKYLAIYFYVRSQRDELQRQIRADLLPLARVPVLGIRALEQAILVRINSTCGTVFDEDNFLCALDLQLADTGNGGVDPQLADRIMRSIEERSEDNLNVEEPQEQPRIRKRDRWLKDELDRINDRIDRMDQRKELWVIRDRMDDIDDRLTDLGMEIQEVREQGAGGKDNPLANLSDLTGRNLTIRFDRNSNTLNPEYRVMLNEVFEQLARAPGDRVLITGYTDKSGDPTTNMYLSEQRALAVRNYLMQRGIEEERLLVNHYGDSRSMGRNPDERRVEIEWLR